jgi:hypothetical protein
LLISELETAQCFFLIYGQARASKKKGGTGMTNKDEFEKILTWKPGMLWDVALEEMRRRREEAKRQAVALVSG